jgi:hypothetical protein
LNVAAPRLLIALVTYSVSPQTIGLECASPAIGVRHSTLSPVAGFHVSGRSCLSLTPAASRPRNDGQSPALAATRRRGPVAVPTVRRICRGVATATIPGGSHRLRSRIIVRALHPSSITSRPTPGGSSVNR